MGDLVAVLGGHPNSTRHHLRVLVTAGLVHADVPAGERGRGRPAVRHVVTPEGRDAASGSLAGDPSVTEYLLLAGVFAVPAARVMAGRPIFESRTSRAKMEST